MRKPDKVSKIYSCVFGLLLLILTGCSKESDAPSDMQPVQEAEDNMQTEVMERIFGDHTEYSDETLNQLKQVMLLSEQNEADVSIYGKTGMGKAHGIVVDSWFTGFADTDGRRIYFCVYLGETDGADVSSAKAREIAVEIVLGQNEEK